MRIVRVRALIDYEGKILCVQHYHHPEDTWALPGGRVEVGEVLTDAMKRELVEELGIDPKVGSIKYVHQLFLKNGDESLEFFFEILNPEDYLTIDLPHTSHGVAEIREFGFIDPAKSIILPEFLANYENDKSNNKWPIFQTRTADGI